MNETELKELLEDMEYCMDNDFRRTFESSDLYTFFKRLMDLVLRDSESLDADIIRRLDILTDNIDQFDFPEAKKNINDLKKIL
jgi:transcription termination factor NusB